MQRRRSGAGGRPGLAAGVAAGLLAGLLGGAAAQERPVPLEAQTAVAVTIYNEDLALVRDRREVTLEAGANSLAFVDVSGRIRPETALLRDAQGALAVREQNFDFDLLTPEKLLEKSVGRSVRLIRTHPETGEDRVEEGTLLSVAGGIVLRIGDRIETNPPGRIVFAEVPENLRARPTLVIALDSIVGGRQPIELSYLTGGLGWRADYVASLNAAEDRLDLNGWVTLTNSSGTAYRDARLQLVAGEVNQVREAMLQRDLAVTAEMAAPAPAMTAEALFEYHLYTLDRPTTIADNQTKQVALLAGTGVPVEKSYRFFGLGNLYDPQTGEPERVSATVRLAFDNGEAEGLGLPLPQGIVRVYKQDAAGQPLFVGEDRIEHTPKGESVELTLGRAFDVTARARQTEFERLGDRVIEAAFEVEIRNAKPAPITVTVTEPMPGQWRILEESHPHEKATAQQAEWSVPVPAEGQALLRYRVRVTF